MPENIHDNSSTKTQNDIYLVDPLNPRAKPYSTVQKAANEANKGRAILYYKDGPDGGRVFEAHEVEAALAKGWRDTPYKHPNNPEHVPPVEPETASSPERDVLMMEAKELGLNPHPRLGVDKLRKLIAEASDG